MKTFLQNIAESYINTYSDEIKNFCFVFPNKRCCIFFEKYVRELSISKNSNDSQHSGIIIPNTIDINSFIMKTTYSVELSKIELLFILYDCYKDLVGKENTVNFDSFARWGEIAINDFNDIDRALVDAKEILNNTTHFDQIKTDFLTKEQLEVIDRHFRSSIKNNIIKDNNDNMWMHYQGDNGSQILHRFKTLWSVLPELYERFTSTLNERQVCYSGMSYRKIAEKGYLDDKLENGRLRYSKYIFIGFNALSNSEQKLFDWMNSKGLGDFYWDSESPFLTEDNIAGRFVKEYKNRYKSELKINSDNSNIPVAEIIGIPSRVGQTKFAAKKIQELFKDDKNINTKVNTAIVLPDESLCTYLLRSFNPEPETSNDDGDTDLKINITMGYPMANTPVTSLIKAIINLEHRARNTSDGYAYFYTDILELLAHPLLRKFEPKLVGVLSDMTNNEHKFTILRDEIIKRCQDKDIECYFPRFDDTENIFEAFSGLLNHIENEVNNDTLLNSFVKKYKQSLLLIKDLCSKHEIFLNRDTLAQMMHKLSSSETVNFEGMPLLGVQIMGVLETRALDFENVIILSMNEKVYPKKLFRKSLIPYELRQGYKITTPDVQESIFAYYFYRLLTRTKRIFFVYDSRTGEGKSEMSRYLYQIKNIFRNTFKDKLSEIQYTFDICQLKERKFEIPKINDTTEEMTVQKDNAILKQLLRFTKQENNNKRYFSASAINKYIACPLEFFLEYISDFREEDEAKTYVDDAMYGTILHEAFQKFYKYCKENLHITVFDIKTLEEIVSKRQNAIEHTLVASFKKNYYATTVDITTKPDLLTIDNDIPAELQMLADIMKSFMIRAFKCEIDYLNKEKIKNYEYIASELEFKYHFKIDDSTTINTKGFIDRIDVVTFNDGHRAIRIIDYKTGSDKTEFPGIDSLFESSDNKAIFQLFLYSKIAHECIKNKGFDKYTGHPIITITPELIKKIEFEKYTGLPIIPLIYKIRTLAVAPIDYLKLKKDKKLSDVTDFYPFENDFTEKFCEKMQELFNPDIPFIQTSDASHCDYCRFASICGKENKL